MLESGEKRSKMEYNSPKEEFPSLFENLPARFILPVGVTITLFILTIFLLLIPLLEKNMMDEKRKSIMHLTETAWSSLNRFYIQAEAGELSHGIARQKAVDHLRQMRYGVEFEDYFWLNDMIPKMIMHPYRPDLVGKDVSGFKDPAGNQLFVRMVDTVKKDGQGFVDYLWQWKGNPDNIVPKISYVKGFEPWGWVVGTGIYVEDVRQEIRAVTRQLTWACSGIMILFLFASAYILWQGAKGEKERKRAMEESRLREQQLVQADKMTSLGILVAGVAHEVNNPVTSIMLSAPSLKKAWTAFQPVLDEHFEGRDDQMVCNMPYKELSKRVDAMLAAIEDSAERIKQIITELKDFSRPHGPDSGVDMDQVVDIRQVVEKSLDLTHTVLKKRTRHLTADIGAELPLIRGNAGKLQQVVVNLLVNAAQALEHEDQSIDLSVSGSRDGRWVEIRVTDTGPGVSPDTLKRMKDPFFTTRRDDGGTGLGLSISHKIVTDHGGTLEFESKPSRDLPEKPCSGLTAQIRLPIDGKNTQISGALDGRISAHT